MARNQPSLNNRNHHTHGRPASRGNMPEQTATPILEPFRYDAYGQATRADAPGIVDTGETGEGWNYMFQGIPVDPAALNEFRNRAMHPTVMPWRAQDPFGYVDGLNVYAAGDDNPINRTEPA